MKTLLITILLSSTIILVWCGNNEIKQEVVINTWTIVEQFKNNTWIIDNNEANKEVAVNIWTNAKAVVSSWTITTNTWIEDINKDIVNNNSWVKKDKWIKPIPVKLISLKWNLSNQVEDYDISVNQWFSETEKENNYDTKSLKKFSNSRYYKNNKFVFYSWYWWLYLVEWANPKTFKVIKYNNWLENYDWETSYWTDWNKLFVDWIKYEKSDLKTFKIFESGFISWDKFGIYTWAGWFETQVNQYLSWDIKTIEFIGGSYYRDKRFIYCPTRRGFSLIKWADPRTFEILEWTNFSREKNTVFNECEKIEWADPRTFEIIGSINTYEYYKDKNRVYCNWEWIEWADPKTFEIIDQYFTKDKYGVYNDWTRKEWIKDIGTFTVKDWVAQDSKCIYEKKDYYSYICKEK